MIVLIFCFSNKANETDYALNILKVTQRSWLREQMLYKVYLSVWSVVMQVFLIHRTSKKKAILETKETTNQDGAGFSSPTSASSAQTIFAASPAAKYLSVCNRHNPSAHILNENRMKPSGTLKWCTFCRCRPKLYPCKYCSGHLWHAYLGRLSF